MNEACLVDEKGSMSKTIGVVGLCRSFGRSTADSSLLQRMYVFFYRKTKASRRWFFGSRILQRKEVADQRLYPSDYLCFKAMGNALSRGGAPLQSILLPRLLSIVSNELHRLAPDG